MEAGIKFKWGTHESIFISILAHESNEQLRLVFDEYQKMSGQSIEKSILSEFTGDIEKGLLAIGQYKIR